MFDYVFSASHTIYSVLRHTKITSANDGIIPVVWSEHCIECAAPRCYATCPRYLARRDGHCVRVKNGISPCVVGNRIAANVCFLPWAKIECQIAGKPMRRNAYARVCKIVYVLDKTFDFVAKCVPFHSIKRFIYEGWFSVRQKCLARLGKGNINQPLLLEGEVVNVEKATSLLVDLKTCDKLLFRSKIEISKYRSNFFVSLPPYADGVELVFLDVHPADVEAKENVCFGSLILRLRLPQEGKKVKLVIWDLDNTLWKGILVENSNVVLCKEFADIIKMLDAKGIVSSVASKNNFEQAWTKLQQLGLDEYFVFPKIDWNPKSANIAKTIQQMNINPDTVVFVDDNPMELHEVSLMLPSVTCVMPDEMENLVKSERFNVVVTDESRKRRNTYKMIESMKHEEEEWQGNLDEFIAQCRIVLKVSQPKKANIKRCYELLQRTNQLNSSGRRLSFEEVEKLVFDNPHGRGYVLEASDKFGDYGIVAFLLTETVEDKTRVTDFVISCRVANRKIEPTLINELARISGGEIEFVYRHTGLNEPMYRIIAELSMIEICSYDKEETTVYLHKYNPNYPRLVNIVSGE